MNAGVGGLGVRRWSYLPLTRTRRKLLTCGFATPRRSPALLYAPRPSAKRLWSLRDRLDEYTTSSELIAAHREGATAASL
ncbi:MAG: hypothetical protein M3460_30030 [Actinomycetota bacterium]|nr:hypothetical protein [Actinomycetota bacterium]